MYIAGTFYAPPACIAAIGFVVGAIGLLQIFICLSNCDWAVNVRARTHSGKDPYGPPASRASFFVFGLVFLAAGSGVVILAFRG